MTTDVDRSVDSIGIIAGALGGSFTGNGNITVAVGLTVAGPFDVNGSVLAEVSVAVQPGGSIAGTGSITTAVFTVSGGSISGRTVTADTVQLLGGAVFSDIGNVVANNSLAINGATLVLNFGYVNTVAIQWLSSAGIPGFPGLGGPGAISGTGSLQNGSHGSFTFTTTDMFGVPAESVTSVPFTNNGATNVNAGTLRFTTSYLQDHPSATTQLGTIPTAQRGCLRY